MCGIHDLFNIKTEMLSMTVESLHVGDLVVNAEFGLGKIELTLFDGTMLGVIFENEPSLILLDDGKTLLKYKEILKYEH